ncbi:general stress protein [Pseudalkalibacillus sp. R45]|uniref:general stress protein n=1 Tax=Pseudalkalibacillus sp. R45 TaxID=3457433 RepID=UPI003FCC3382
MKRHLEKRFAFLYTGELTSFLLFIFLSYFINRTYPGLHLYSLYSFWLSFGLLEFILLQGSLYWYVKRRQLQTIGSPITPLSLVNRLYHLQKWNLFIILVGPLIFVWDVFMWNPQLPIGGLALALFLYLFAIAEYINYFHIQLSYDNKADLHYLFTKKKLKKASLRRDIKRLKNRS